MNKRSVKSGQDGFVLIVAMILMVVMGIFAMGSMRSAAVGEKIAGGYRERNQAFMAAEQALAQGQALLRANAVTCLESVCDNTNLVGTAASYSGNSLPSTWPQGDTNTSTITVASGQTTSGRYLINALTNAAFAKVNCSPYSVMGRGVGINANDTVLLQTVVYICPAD
jgi:type IV pilus assembly protein PilX